jgi:hypothetical protein
VPVVEQAQGPWGHKALLSVEVDAHPQALVFKGTQRGVLKARICGQSGFAELYVSYPAELLAAYRERAAT